MIVGEDLPKYIIKWLWKNAFNFPNVIGFSVEYQAWVAGKNVFDIPVIRFYVDKKVDLKDLLPNEIIPSLLKIRNIFRIKEFKIDVVNIGPLWAIPPIPNDVRTSTVDKTQNFRPVELGVSIGNEAITAGSLGMLYTGIDGQLYVGGSNAHVLIPDVSMTVEQVIASKKINILQRGAYHGGKIPEEVVGIYLWHQQIGEYEAPPSTCPIANFSAWFLNGIAWVFHRQSRLKAFADPPTNTIDFGLYTPLTEHILKIADDSINPHNMFVGHLFAGGDTVGVICKISEILKRCPYAIKPINGNWGEVQIGDKIKMCSFWCNTEREVIDTNAVVNVNYGTFTAVMTNCILVENDGTIKGGYSGSGVFKV